MKNVNILLQDILKGMEHMSKLLNINFSAELVTIVNIYVHLTNLLKMKRKSSTVLLIIVLVINIIVQKTLMNMSKTLKIITMR
jgi:hypothetical protein